MARTIVRISGVLAIAFATTLGSAPAWAACAALPVGTTMPTPAEILSANPDGGGAMASQIRNLVAANPSQLSAVMAMAVGASSGQRAAIGTGLGQAAGVCNRPEPATSTAIQEAVVASANRDVIAAFQGATADTRTTAVGGGGATGGGVGGGGTVGGALGAANTGTSPYVPASTTTASNAGFNSPTGVGLTASLASTSRTASILSTSGTTQSSSNTAASNSTGF